MPASLYDSLITQLSLQIDKKTTLSKKFKFCISHRNDNEVTVEIDQIIRI